MKTYNELLTIPSFVDRFNYLAIGGHIGIQTFGGNRYLNQVLYKSPEWKKFRRSIILRDSGKLAHPDYPFYDGELIIVHHINPITVDMALNRDPLIFDPNNVVCVSDDLHRAIHYGDSKVVESIVQPFAIREKNDTCPWRNK